MSNEAVAPRGRPAKANVNSFRGTGPYRRIRTNPKVPIQGVRAKVFIPGFQDGIDEQAQALCSRAIWGEGKLGSRPNIYLSGRGKLGRMIDIGVQLGFDDNDRNVLKPIANSGKNDAGGKWTWHNPPRQVPVPDEIYMEFFLRGGQSHFHLLDEPGFDPEKAIWSGSSSDGVWAGPWTQFAYVTSIAVPQDLMHIYGHDEHLPGWCVGVIWEDREVLVNGHWRRLTKADVGEFGAYPQRKDFLDSAKKVQWLNETPIFVDELNGGAFDVASEYVAIDIRRARTL